MSVIDHLPMPARFESPHQRPFKKAEEWSDKLAPVALIALLILFAVWAWFACRNTRLQFDELLEISAATAPTARGVLSFLASGVDYNPPLSHFFIRASMSFLGDSEMAARLPAFLGLVTLLICLYALLARQLGRSYGIVAVLTILCLPVRDYAVQARPYGVVLGLSGLALLWFRSAAQRQHRTSALLGLALSTAGLMASHYYAILVIGVLVAVELVKVWQRKPLDWALLACCAGPPLAVLFALRDAMKQQRQALTHYFARGNLLSFDHGYDALNMDPLVYCTALLLVVGVLAFYWKDGEGRLAVGSLADLPPQDTALALGFLLIPIAGAFLTQFVTHAYVTRYFLPAAIGLALCICYVAKVFSSAVPCVAMLLILPAGLGFGKAVMQEVSRPPETLASIEALTAEQTPLLFDTPANYAQIYHYFPSLRSNMWVIVDPAASFRYRHYDTDDKIMLALANYGRAQTISLSAAVRQWPQFRLVPRSADYVWALKCVMDAGSQINVKHPFGADNFIFDVTVQPGSVAQIDACAAPTP